MKRLLVAGGIIFYLSGGPVMSQSIFDFTMNDIDGKPVHLKKFQGNVILVVNVASKCGFTPQYTGLQALYERYRDKGLVVMGFPANNFMFQEPGADAEIKQFCSLKYNVTFPMFSKISAKGRGMAPLYKWLTAQKTAPEGPGAVSWNFNKFLVNRSGQAVYRFGSKTDPLADELVRAVEALLSEKASPHE
jgi:glutathione peroxidase-family protein